MVDAIQCAERARSALNSDAAPDWKRAAEACSAFAELQLEPGLPLDFMPDDMRQRLDAELAAVNRILADYPNKTAEDYQRLGPAEVHRVLEACEAASESIIETELDRIIAALEAGMSQLPVEEIHQARRHRELMIPRLIRVLREVTAAARTDGTVAEGNAHFFAVLLLTEFGADEAFPAIREAVSLPGELPFDLFGDFITGLLSRVLARFAADSLEVLDEMILDTALNEYVRWEAAEAYLYLLQSGRLTREETVARLRGHLIRAIDQGDNDLASGLVCVFIDMGPMEAAEDIKEAFNRRLVDTALVGWSSVEESIAEGEAGAQGELQGFTKIGIDDTIAELEKWASFREERRLPPDPPPTPHFDFDREVLELASATIVSDTPRVGRNQSCPCGSGKKFKKCCGSRY